MDGKQLMQIIKRAIKPLQNKVMMLVGRCVLLATNDTEGVQKIKASVMAGEIMENVERFQNYGLSSNVPSGAEGVIVFPLGNREHGICIALENRKFRLKDLKEGEVALYTDEGDTIIFKRGGKIEVNASSQVDVNSPVSNINSPITNVSGNMNVGGDLIVTGDATAENINANLNVNGVALIGSASVAAPSVVAGAYELNDFGIHTHSYDDDNGTTVVSKTTGGVS